MNPETEPDDEPLAEAAPTVTPDADQRLKHRMVGLLVFVVAGLIFTAFLPNHSTGDAASSTASSTASSEAASEEESLPVLNIPLGNGGQAMPPVTQTSLPQPSKPSKPPKPVARPASKPASRPVAATTATTSGWWVQIGVFSDPNNANSVATALEVLKQPIKSETLSLDGQDRYRVRLGPFSSQAQAQEILDKANGIGASGGKLVAIP
jgi:cell division septation protein DedD